MFVVTFIIENIMLCSIKKINKIFECKSIVNQKVIQIKKLGRDTLARIMWKKFPAFVCRLRAT